ncbi:MAG: SDR family NAD(P)-dependent oxidoreductase [Proteobacteria bacterium]|nr:MAG: SDR family NAD(P)-dependent oxidoreductase [Pseudomonadota bacterium]
MLVVSGATGKLGGSIIDRLLRTINPAELAISVRDPSKAAHLASRGVRVRAGDFSDPKSLYSSFEGADTVLIVSANSVDQGVLFNTNAIAAAVACGAKRIVYTSHMAANPKSLFAPMPTHAATEEKLKSCGLAFTSLRNGFYADTTLRFVTQALKDGQLVAPEDGPVSWTTHEDLSEAAVAALTAGSSLNGLTPPLTAPDALDFKAIAQITSEIVGREIKRVTVSDEEFKKILTARGLPEPVINIFIGMFKASRQGEFLSMDSTLEKTIGHKPITLHDYLARNIQP